MSLLDVIGPVMVGPSSSHTAGACRLALLARHTLLGPPGHVRFTLHGSFAKTARGHGTDLALVAGMLGATPDDPVIARSFDAAAEAGLAYEFVTADLGDVHPNTVRIEMTARSVDATGGAPDTTGSVAETTGSVAETTGSVAETTGSVAKTTGSVAEANVERVRVTGSSLGGGAVRVFDVDGFRIDFSGGHHTLLVRHVDVPGVIARVARVIADDDVNVAALVCARRKRGGDAMMSIEVDRALSRPALDYLRHLRYVNWLRLLPEVMHIEAVGA